MGGLGWWTGFGPATSRSTIWGSNQAELRPPIAGHKLILGPAGVKSAVSLSLTAGGRARRSPGRRSRRSRNQTERAKQKDFRQKNWRQKNGDKIRSRSESKSWPRQAKPFPFFCLQFFCLKCSRK